LKFGKGRKKKEKTQRKEEATFFVFPFSFLRRLKEEEDAEQTKKHREA